MPHETHYDCQVGLSRRRLSSMCGAWQAARQPGSHIATAAALITAAETAAAAWQIITIERDADSTETEKEREQERRRRRRQRTKVNDFIVARCRLLPPACILLYCIPPSAHPLCACALKVLAAGNSCCCCLRSLHSFVAILIGIVSLCVVAVGTF